MSFDAGHQIPENTFAKIDEWAGNEERSCIVGTIHFSRLANGNWWKEKGVSLLLLPDAFVTHRTKKEKRALAAI